MTVELDAFSGRPNPVWELDAQHAAALTALHQGLAEQGAVGAATGAVEPPALGYRGFVYRVGAEACRAYRGMVRTPRAMFSDPGSAIERFLIASLPAEWEDLEPMMQSELRERG